MADNTGDSAVALVGVTKSFGGHVAVDDLTLTVADGEFFSLLGPSGCGKTTTLRMLAGFERPDAGAVLLHDGDVTDTPPERRAVNTVFQSYALFEHLDVQGNVAFGLRRRGVGRAETHRRVAEALELVQLTGRERHRPRQLSGGQQQRVALARALVNHPRVLLLDEPLGALDLKLRRHMQVELKRIQREVGITFLYVTHDQEEALAMSDRIAVMNDGRIEQCDRPEVVYEEPATRFVADFLGTSNLMTGRVAGAAVRLDAGALVECRPPTGTPDGAEVAVTVRPERLRVGDAPAGGTALKGTVVDRVYLGAGTKVLVDAGAGTVLTVLEPPDIDAADRPPVGGAVTVWWEPRHARCLA